MSRFTFSSSNGFEGGFEYFQIKYTEFQIQTKSTFPLSIKNTEFQIQVKSTFPLKYQIQFQIPLAKIQI